MPDPIVIAVPKGRILKALVPLFRSAGLDVTALAAEDRRLVRDGAGVKFLLLKPDDVPTYVEYGVADVGVVGRDVLLERNYDVYAPVDLGIGICRLVVAGLPGTNLDARHRGRALRVATKFPNCARKFFDSRGQAVETIFVQGSVELAPLTGLSDVIVDLVESGETLKQNGLIPLATIFDVSSVLVANRVGFKLKRAELAPLLERLKESSHRQAGSLKGVVET